MMARDLFVYISLASPVMVAVILFIVPMMIEVEEEGAELVSPALAYGFLLLNVGISVALVYWRYSVISSLLSSGVETPGEVTSITRSGDATMVEYTYRWQAETIKSTRKVSGYIPKRRVKEEVGLKATLLVDPSKPTRFLVLDSVR